jgi:hypothetical protein
MTKEASKKRRGLPSSAKVALKAARAVLVPTLCLIALFAGLMIGYTELGGQDASDVFKFSTWKHVYDLVFAE